MVLKSVSRIKKLDDVINIRVLRVRGRVECPEEYQSRQKFSGLSGY